MQIVKSVNIRTKDGGMMTIDLSAVLLEKIRDSFGLQSQDEINAHHVETFLIVSMKNALREAS